MHGLAVGEKRHALPAEGDEQRLEPEPAAQAPRAALEIGLRLPAADHLAQLGAVRRHHGGAAVARPVVALGIDEHLLPRRLRHRDHARDVREPSLAVVGEDHHVARRQRGLEVGEFLRQHLARGRRLEVDAQQLLALAEDAQLLGRSDRLVAMKLGPDLALFEKRFEDPSLGIVAHDRKQRRVRPEGGAVGRDVRRAARLGLLPAPQHDRHRRLGRDARGLAEPVAVEHHVAHHQDARLPRVGRSHLRRPIAKYSMP